MSYLCYTVIVLDNVHENVLLRMILPMAKRVTIKEVAARAGVSYQTVSRVINDKGEVSPEVRVRVHGICDTRIDARRQEELGLAAVAVLEIF